MTVLLEKTAATRGRNTLGFRVVRSNPAIADLAEYKGVPATRGGLAVARVEAFF